MLVTRARIHKIVVRMSSREDLIRLPLKSASALFVLAFLQTAKVFKTLEHIVSLLLKANFWLQYKEVIIMVHKRPLQKETKIALHDRLLLNAGKKYSRMPQESILQYF